MQDLVQRVREDEAVGLWRLQNGILFFKNKIYLAAESPLIPTIIDQFHGSTHEGFLKTLWRIRSNFYWTGMRQTIRDFLKKCDTSQWHKAEQLSPAGLLQPLPVPNQIWEDIAMDFIDGLPLSSAKSTILVVVDRLSKYGHFIAISHPYTAIGVARIFFDNVFKLHGMPRSIVCDRDSIFISLFWQETFWLNRTSFNFSSSYHPQTDGQSELVNRTLEMS